MTRLNFKFIVRLAALGIFAVTCTQANTALEPRPRGKVFYNGETWSERHAAKIAKAEQSNPEIIFVGDSITHYWERPVDSGRGGGLPIWEQYWSPYNALNLGFSGDSTEHVLWRLENGAVEHMSPKLAIVLIGTNNWNRNTPEEISDGIYAVCSMLREKLPHTKVLLLSILPRSNRAPQAVVQVHETNKILHAQEITNDGIQLLDISGVFLDENGVLIPSLMPDGLHPNTAGYEAIAEALAPVVEKLVRE